jgi:outer membrane murein-binding lipoprotein Lpp
MDMQETIDSLRTVLESVIAPGVKDLRTRLDGVEKSVDRLDGRVEHLAERMEEGFARADTRIDNVNARMEEGFARMDMRMDAFNARMDSLMTAIISTRSHPEAEASNARLDRLEREVQEMRKA